MMDVVKEGDILLNMFQKEFRKMHSDLVDKEVRLFHHIFHHLFATRLAKLEQFLLKHYDEFAEFEPDYAPLDQTHERPAPSQPPSPPPIQFVIKEEGFDIDMEEEEAVPFCTDYENAEIHDQNLATDIDNFLPIHDSDSNSGLEYVPHSDGNNDDSDGNYEPTRAANRTLGPRTNKPSTSFAMKGRKRNPVWECYQSTFDPSGKVLTNICRRCGHHVSPKSSRLQMHLLKCSEVEADATAFKIPNLIKLQLKKFEAQVKMEEQQQRLHKQHVASKKHIILSSIERRTNITPRTEHHQNQETFPTNQES